VRPEIENDAIPGQHARTAVVQIHLDGLGRSEATDTHDQLGAARLVGVEVHGDRAIDHVTFARQHSLHVGGDGTRHHSEPICVVNQIGDFCAPDLVLAGKTVGVRAGAADQFALDDGGVTPRLGHLPSQQFAPAPLPRTSISKRSGWDIFNSSEIALRLPRGALQANARSSKPIPDRALAQRLTLPPRTLPSLVLWVAFPTGRRQPESDRLRRLYRGSATPDQLRRVSRPSGKHP